LKPGEQSFEDLFRANFSDVLAFALRRCRSQQDAEDVTAETFAVAWRRLDDVPLGDGARLWLFGVARHALLNRARTLRRQRSLVDRLTLLVFSAARLQRTESFASGSDVLDALERLSPPDREILILHAWDGLSADEMAVVLDISTAAAWKRVQRARERLATALARRSTLPGTTTQQAAIKETP
jgi:RNA polymerase sigma-70 factor, ECF subfamily